MVAVPGCEGRAGLKAGTRRAAGMTDRHNGFNAVKRMAVLADVTNLVPELTTFGCGQVVVKCVEPDQRMCFSDGLPTNSTSTVGVHPTYQYFSEAFISGSFQDLCASSKTLA